MFIPLLKKDQSAWRPAAKKSTKKQAVLFLISCILLTFFFLLPRNNRWLQSKPLAYLTAFFHQIETLDVEHRKQERWGASYTLSKQIAGLLAHEATTDSLLVVVPPKGYFKDRQIDYPVPEPAVFYYYTGIKTVWANSPAALRANRMVYAANGVLFIDTVADKNRLADSLRIFKSYKIGL